jgi:hypothetical protein
MINLIFPYKSTNCNMPNGFYVHEDSVGSMRSEMIIRSLISEFQAIFQ